MESGGATLLIETWQREKQGSLIGVVAALTRSSLRFAEKTRERTTQQWTLALIPA